MAYADTTKVPIVKTKADIEAVLKKYGAGSFGYMANEGKDGERVTLAFKLRAFTYRFDFLTPKSEQAARTRWRAVLLVIKGKLESVDAKIETIEEAFMAHIVVEGGQTVAEWLKPELNQALVDGRMPQRLHLEGPKQ